MDSGCCLKPDILQHYDESRLSDMQNSFSKQLYLPEISKNYYLHINMNNNAKLFLKIINIK